MSILSLLLLLHDLLNVHIGHLVVKLSLLGSKLVSIGLLASAKFVLKRLTGVFLILLSLVEHVLVSASSTLHQTHQFSAHLSLIIGSHSELLANSLSASFKLFLLLDLKVSETILLELVLLLLDSTDTFSLSLVVGILKCLINLLLLFSLVALNEISSLLVVLVIKLLLGLSLLILDLFGVLLLLKFTATLKSLLQDAIEFLFLTLLVHVHQAFELHQVVLVVLKELLLFL